MNDFSSRIYEVNQIASGGVLIVPSRSAPIDH